MVKKKVIRLLISPTINYETVNSGDTGVHTTNASTRINDSIQNHFHASLDFCIKVIFSDNFFESNQTYIFESSPSYVLGEIPE